MKNLVLLLTVLFCVSCGTDLFDGPRGLQGPPGPSGADGAPGAQGPAGQDGADAPISPNNIASVIDPCGDAPGIVDEVLLQLASGELLVFFANNVNSDYGRLAIIPPGSYMTTDGQNCYFTVNADHSVIW